MIVSSRRTLWQETLFILLIARLFDYILYIVVFSLPLRKIAANYCRLKPIKYTELLLKILKCPGLNTTRETHVKL